MADFTGSESHVIYPLSIDFWHVHHSRAFWVVLLNEMKGLVKVVADCVTK